MFGYLKYFKVSSSPYFPDIPGKKCQASEECNFYLALSEIKLCNRIGLARLN